MLVLLGIAVVVAGFIARINPLLVILIAAVVTGVLAAVAPGVDLRALFDAGVTTLSRFGEAFNDNRYFHITWLILPVIGVLERAGLQEKARQLISTVRAATDNIGLFFGEDIFIAIGSIVLMVGFLEQAGLKVEALHISLWAIPTAVAAFIVHGVRLWLFDRALKRDLAAPTTDPEAAR
jgi:uncharacterized membrane protein